MIDVALSGAVVRPGDTLIVSTSDQLKMGVADLVREQLASELPGVHVVVLDNVNPLVVYRPGA